MRRDKDHEKLDTKKLGHLNGGHTGGYHYGGNMRKNIFRQHHINILVYAGVFLVVFV